jgi:hypothetical protein
VDSAGSVGVEEIIKIIFCQSVLEVVAFFSGILRWLWLILANSLRIVGGLLREPDSLDRAIDTWDLGGVVRAIDNVAFLQGYADPFWRLVLCVKLLVGCCMDSIFIFIEGTWLG